MRTRSCTLALLLCCPLSADDKKDAIDPAKLVGKWCHKDKADDKDKGYTIEFTNDGKATLILDKDGVNEGTYKLDGNKLTIVTKVGNAEIKWGWVISKVNDTEIVAKSEEGKEEFTMVKIKDKK